MMDSQTFPTSAEIDSATMLGTTAAPLLAGFSMTLIGLLIGASTPSDAIMWPELCLLLLMLAVVLFVVSVQLTVVAKSTAISQEEHKARVGHLSDEIRLKAFAGAMRDFDDHARRAELAFTIGLGLLLLTLALLVYPAEYSLLRYIAASVACIAVIGEAWWAIKRYQKEQAFLAVIAKTTSEELDGAAKTVKGQDNE